MTVCSVPGCDKRHEAKGFCKTHYMRFRRSGEPEGGRTPNGEPFNFYKSVVMSHEGDDCLIWPYATAPNGYGQMWVDGKAVTVSRYLCQDVLGPGPSSVHEAAHSCGNGHLGCVSKKHVSWKTHSENMADKLVHGTHNRGERHNMAKLRNEDVIDIRSRRGLETQRVTAERYGISASAVAGIQSGRKWASV